MSEVGTPAPVAEPTLIEQEGSIPETVVIPEEIPETPPETPAEAEPAPAQAKQAESEKPKRTPWYQTRIDEITKARREAERKVTELEAKLGAANPEKPAEGQPTQVSEDVILQRAEQIVAQREFKAKAEHMMDAGNKEFGPSEFNDRCNVVASLGAGDRADFMEIVTDPDIIPDGHKLIGALADDPEEAQRIFKLPATKMAAALVQFQSKIKPAEKPISQAPAPIKPIGGSAKPSAPNDTDDMKTWLAKRNATARMSAGGKPNTH
jgi:hypothetical protein